jgi:tRNA wybutosine-synthesizing protein 2
LKSPLLPYARIICKNALNQATNVKSFAIASHIKGEYRKPTIIILAGDESTVTIHKESGCLYKLDASEIMFSSGNHYERKRLLSLIKPRENILDMFCCVGNLSMLIACSRQDIRVTGIELNPVAYKYLLETIRLNSVKDRFTAIFGDNREVKIEKHSFNRVIMGYFTVDDLQLLKAIMALKPEGGILHIHDVPRWNDKTMKERMTNLVNELKDKNVLNIAKFSTRQIKWIAENVPHVVHDVEIEN